MKHNGYFCAICVLLVLLSSACIDREAPVDKKKLLGDDFRLFQGTIAWNLAKAVQDENADEIRRQVQDKNIPIDSPEFQYQALMMRICFGLFLSQSPILPIACTIRGHGQLRDGGTQKEMEGFLEIRALAWYNTGNFSNGEKGI